MKYIIVGTNRSQSRSLGISQVIKSNYQALGDRNIEIMNLAELPLEQLSGSDYGKPLPAPIEAAIQKIDQSEGLIFVVPEYNGSMPGALKYFIDFWHYPQSFENRPVALVGLGTTFGGLRPVEHLQGVLGYRNAFIFPQRVFLMNIHKTFKDGVLSDALANQLLQEQASGFLKFIRALQSEGLDANTRLALKAAEAGKPKL